MYRLARCILPLYALALAACASLAPSGAPVSVPAFELAGRIAVHYQDRAFTSALRWKQAAGADELWLTAPLGQTIAHLESDAGGATLTGPDQKQYRAGSIESLTQSALGWRLPVNGMRYWVRGQAAPGMMLAALETDGARRITRFLQDDWQVSFGYAAGDATRPSRIDLTNGDAQLRLVIDSLSDG